jgi:4-hydroxybenzoate polyprenyltransferase
MKQNGLKPRSSHLSSQPSGLSTKIRIYLRLGRVSNLPTVWTNTLAGVVLAGGSLESPSLLALLAAFTAFYTGGMFLNDAFDRDNDAKERADRPIPAGLIHADDVFGIGYGMIGAGVLIVIWLTRGQSVEAAVSAIILAIAIVGYDASHKNNALSPWLMGLCRTLIYITGSLTVADRLSAPVLAGAGVLLMYVTGLTSIAKRKNTSPRTVGNLIAGISLLDGLLMAARGAMLHAAIAVLGFFLTRRWQRYVQGT